jgi:NADH-quinone oxidoreductase subunit L
MVTAGVYMVARSSAIYMRAPAAMEAVAIVGLTTAFFAATIGLLQNDIKKVFAYSTVSQLGYMFLGAGVGAFSAGIYHLVTHAFFKALLFLGAGSVIHALGGEQDVRNMGGLRKKIPWTFWTMMCAAVAIAGVPPFAGFYSKDAILAAADRHAHWMYWVGVITAGMTAFYVFRAIFLAFYGEYRGKAHPHESPFVMIGPLAVLAALSLGGGYFFKIPEFLAPLFPPVEEGHDIGPMLVSVAFGFAGIALAWLFYVAKPGLPDQAAATFSGLYKLIYNKYFVDEVYEAVVVNPVVSGSREVLWKGVDVAVVDGAVNGMGNRAREIGGVLQRLQSGNIRSYAAWVLLGSVVLLFIMGVMGGLR